MTTYAYVKFFKDVHCPNAAPSKDNVRRIFTSPQHVITREGDVVTIVGSANIGEYPFASVEAAVVAAEPAIVEAPKPRTKKGG